MDHEREWCHARVMPGLPSKPTFVSASGTSAMCQKQTSR
jgi:hypothetical protein